MNITPTSRPQSRGHDQPPTSVRTRHEESHRRPRDVSDDDDVRRDAFTSQARTLLASTLDDGDWYLQGLAELAVPGFADWCVVETASEEGTFHVRAEAHADDLKKGLATELRRVRPRDAGSPYSVSSATKTGRAALIADLGDAIESGRPKEREEKLAELIEVFSRFAHIGGR